jgi:hypothetical protein
MRENIIAIRPCLTPGQYAWRADSVTFCLRRLDNTDKIFLGTKNLVPGEGFEPPTFGLQNRCTTAVLTRRGVTFIINEFRFHPLLIPERTLVYMPATGSGL